MNSNIQIFNNTAFGSIRAIDIDNSPYFVAKDVCNALGYAKARNAIQQHVDSEDALKQGIPTNGGIQEMLLINESGVYALIFVSQLESAKQFKKWVTSEVLPSIRKSGGYMVAHVDETPEQIMARALLVAQDTIARQKERADMAERKAVLLQSQNEAQSKMLDAKDTTIQFLRPGATFAKAVQTSDTSCLIGDLARIIKQNGIEIGQNRLFEWLRKKNYLISRKGESYNLPTQSALNLGLFEIKKTVITKPDGTSLVTTTPKVTGKGQVYFVNKFLYDSINEAELERQRKIEQDRKEGKL